MTTVAKLALAGLMLMAVTLMEGGCSYLAFAASDPDTDVGFLADGSMAIWAVDARNSSLSFIATGLPRFVRSCS